MGFQTQDFIVFMEEQTSLATISLIKLTMCITYLIRIKIDLLPIFAKIESSNLVQHKIFYFQTHSCSLFLKCKTITEIYHLAINNIPLLHIILNP